LYSGFSTLDLKASEIVLPVILAGKSDLATGEARIQIPPRLEASLMLSEIDRSDGASDCQHRDRIYVPIEGIDIKRPLPRTCEGQVAAI